MKTLVVGFGNTLMGDDGVGHRVISELAARDLPAGVRVEECGSDSLVLPGLWRGEERVWIVDAVVGGNPPGTIHYLDHEEVMSIPQRHATVHHLSLPEGLRWIALTFPEMSVVRYRMWGIEPKRLDLGEDLSPEVLEAVETTTLSILEELRH